MSDLGFVRPLLATAQVEKDPAPCGVFTLQLQSNLAQRLADVQEAAAGLL